MRVNPSRPNQGLPSIVVAGLVFSGIGLTCLVAAQPAVAQDSGTGAADDIRIAPQIRPDAAASLKLPADMAAPPAFSAMTQFEVEGGGALKFAIDPESVRFAEKIIMMTVAAQSRSGATTTGYYAIDCQNDKYRLLGLPSGGGWKAGSSNRWRKVRDLKRRPPQFTALHQASCLLGGFRVGDVRELTTRLAQGERFNQ